MPNSSRSTCRALLSDGNTRCRGRLARSAHACSLHVEAHDASYERYKTAAEVALRLRPHMQIKRSEVRSLPSGSLNTRMEGVRAYMKAVRREMELREEHDRRFVGTPDDGHRMRIEKLNAWYDHCKGLLHALRVRKQAISRIVHPQQSRTPVLPQQRGAVPSRTSSPVPQGRQGRRRRPRPHHREEQRLHAHTQPREQLSQARQRLRPAVIEEAERDVEEEANFIQMLKEATLLSQLQPSERSQPSTEEGSLAESQTVKVDVMHTDDRDAVSSDPSHTALYVHQPENMTDAESDVDQTVDYSTDTSPYPTPPISTSYELANDALAIRLSATAQESSIPDTEFILNEGELPDVSSETHHAKEVDALVHATLIPAQETMDVISAATRTDAQDSQDGDGELPVLGEARDESQLAVVSTVQRDGRDGHRAVHEVDEIKRRAPTVDLEAQGSVHERGGSRDGGGRKAAFVFIALISAAVIVCRKSSVARILTHSRGLLLRASRRAAALLYGLVSLAARSSEL
ncbi:hypothetical protein C8Q74DRAFT_246436 [Fomes fomentarius]|nr:hypothetical protein C8Q74DRAFT_246436 [Fomes fomentarius]